MKPLLLNNTKPYKGPWVPLSGNGADRVLTVEGLICGDAVEVYGCDKPEDTNRRTRTPVGVYTENGEHKIVLVHRLVRAARIGETKEPVSVWVS